MAGAGVMRPVPFADSQVQGAPRGITCRWSEANRVLRPCRVGEIRTCLCCSEMQGRPVDGDGMVVESWVEKD